MRAAALNFLLMILCPVAPTAYAEPVTLTDSELDTITAGAVYVSADAKALAIGDGAFTAVNTVTRTGGKGIFEWGFGLAKALACCGSQTDAEVSFNASADGPYVAAFSVVNKYIGVGLPPGNPQFTTATGYAIVVSIDPAALRLPGYPQNTGERPWSNYRGFRIAPSLVARLVRPQLGRPVEDSPNLSTNVGSGTVAYGLAASNASGLSAAASQVSSFTASLLDFSAAAATSISFRD